MPLGVAAEPSALEALVRVKFDERGLVPVVAQEVDGTVLMVAWANREALLAVRTGRATYWSRSRQAIWVKGDTSGHVQEARSMALDCDGDTVLYVVRQIGPACHTGTRSCFSETQEIPWQTSVSSPSSGDDRVAQGRPRADRATPGSSSRTSKARRKVIEEAYEVNEAHQALDAGRDTKDHLAHEAADLLYHLYVLLASADVTPAEVYSVLERRHGAPRRPKAGEGGTP